MPTYVALMSYTQKGIEEVKDAPRRIDQAVKNLEAMGGKLTAFYSVMGEYDYVGIADAPSDEVAATFLLGLGAAGLVRTKTLRAFTREEFEQIVGNLP